MPIKISGIAFMTLALGLGPLDWRGASADPKDSEPSNAPVAATSSDTQTRSAREPTT